MKSNRYIKLLTLFFIFSFSSFVFAQESFIENRFSVKLGVSTIINGNISYPNINPLILIGVDYTLNKFVDIGIYGGYSAMMHHHVFPYNATTGKYEWYSADSTSYDMTGSAGFSSNSKAYCYGINSNFHLLPLIFTKDMRIDVYLTPKIGIISEQYDEYKATQETVWSKPLLEYSLGIGLKYSLTKRFGMYAECSLGNFYYNNKSRAIAGIVLKL